MCPDPVTRRPSPARRFAPRFVVLWQGNEAQGPWSGSCRRAGQHQAGKKTTRVKINCTEAGCGLKGARTPSRRPPRYGVLGVRSRLPAATTLIGSSRHGNGVICRQRRPSSPRPPWEALTRDGCRTWRLVALLFLALLLPAQPHFGACQPSPRRDTGGLGCSGTQERDGRARCLLACPEQTAQQPTMEGRLHLSA